MTYNVRKNRVPWEFLPVRIVKYPHPTLRHKSKPLRKVDAEVRRTIDEMLETMYEHNGLGLAANQVDLPYRMLVISLRGDPEANQEEFAFINPVIIKRSGMAEMEEGCLSFPEIYATIRRPEKVVLSAYTPAGKEVTYELDGIFARAVQHEIDHLDGVVFVDHLGSTGQLAVKEPLADLQRQFESDQRRGIISDDEQIAARLAELEKLRT
jgi:peptide deformylase